MKARFTIVALAAVSQWSYAQPAPPESAPVPPTLSKSTLSPGEQAALKEIPLTQAIQELQKSSADEPRIVVDRRPASTSTSTGKIGAASRVAPRGYQPRGNSLSKTGSSAVDRARQWTNRYNAPAQGESGRVVYVYGKGLPEVVCAPLRICTLELQPGEQVIAEPQIGDSVRWHVTPSVYGSGPNRTELVVIKPQELGLDTNLVLTTNRRVYYIRLVARANDYMPRVAFSYPDDERRAWEEHMARQKRQEAAKVATLNTSLENLNFNYVVASDKGNTEHMLPTRVFDDGQKTFIHLPPGAAHRETPALMIVGADGSMDMVNYRVQGDAYVVDRLFDRAVLVLDVGSNQRRVTISSKSAKQSWRNTTASFPASGDMMYAN